MTRRNRKIFRAWVQGLLRAVNSAVISAGGAAIGSPDTFGIWDSQKLKHLMWVAGPPALFSLAHYLEQSPWPEFEEEEAAPEEEPKSDG